MSTDTYPRGDAEAAIAHETIARLFAASIITEEEHRAIWRCAESAKELQWRHDDDVSENDKRVAAYVARGWKHESCGCCGGIQWGGEEPRECRDCCGSGSIWISPKGHTALYPGGPFTS